MKEKVDHTEEGLKYPIGRFTLPKTQGQAELDRATQTIHKFPNRLNSLVQGLSVSELKWKYRPEGWNISEVIHHCVDSHINAFVRFKRALTENEPKVYGYKESKWALLADNQKLSSQNAIDILVPLHYRWSFLIKNLSAPNLDRGYYHIEKQRVVKILEAIFHYEWHCNHHLAHIELAKKNKF